MDLKIVAPGTAGHRAYRAKIYLEGKELQGVTNVLVECDVYDHNRATISFIPKSLELEGRFKVVEKRLVKED